MPVAPSLALLGVRAFNQSGVAALRALLPHSTPARERLGVRRQSEASTPLWIEQGMIKNDPCVSRLGVVLCPYALNSAQNGQNSPRTAERAEKDSKFRATGLPADERMSHLQWEIHFFAPSQLRVKKKSSLVLARPG